MWCSCEAALPQYDFAEMLQIMQHSAAHHISHRLRGASFSSRRSLLALPRQYDYRKVNDNLSA